MTLIAGAIAFPAATLPAMPVAAVSPIRVVTSSQWTESLGTTQVVHMVGQIQNQSGVNVASVQLNLDWLDSNKVVVGHSSTIATRKVLANLDYSPFEDIEFPAAALNYDNFRVASITYSPSIATPYHLDAVSTPCPSGSPVDEVCGTVTNTGALTVEDVTAILTYTDSSPKTVGQDAWPVDNDNGGSSFAHGDQGHFTFFRLDGHSPISITADAEPSYLVDVSPPSLDIGPVNVGKSGQQDLTLTNNGSLPLHLSTVLATPTPEFAAISHCPSALAPGLACQVTVQLTPAAGGPRPGTLTISDDAAGSQRTVPLTGTGTAPAVAFDPPTVLAFGTALRAGMPGVHKVVTLTNTGDGPLTIISIATDDATNFSSDGSACPAAPYSLPPGAQCPIDVAFAPVIAGPYAANLVVTDDAGTQQLPLTALATGPGAQLRLGGTVISSLDFGQVVLNTPSSPLTITLVNNGTEPLIVTAMTTSGDFKQTTTCGTVPVTMAPGVSCVFILTFTPSLAGPRAGDLTLTDNAANLQQSVAFTGSGVTGASAGRRLSTGIHRGNLHDATIIRRRR